MTVRNGTATAANIALRADQPFLRYGGLPALLPRPGARPTIAETEEYQTARDLWRAGHPGEAFPAHLVSFAAWLAAASRELQAPDA